MAAGQSTLMVTDASLSRASPLPQGFLLNQAPLQVPGLSVLTDGHQTGVTTRRGGIDAQCTLDHQTLQRNVGFALRQTMNPDNRAGTLGHLLADRTQLVGMAMMQNR